MPSIAENCILIKKNSSWYAIRPTRDGASYTECRGTPRTAHPEWVSIRLQVISSSRPSSNPSKNGTRGWTQANHSTQLLGSDHHVIHKRSTDSTHSTHTYGHGRGFLMINWQKLKKSISIWVIPHGGISKKGLLLYYSSTHNLREKSSQWADHWAHVDMLSGEKYVTYNIHRTMDSSDLASWWGT